jgi:hypothetical protein
MLDLSDISATSDWPGVPRDDGVRGGLLGVDYAILISTELGVDFAVKEC